MLEEFGRIFVECFVEVWMWVSFVGLWVLEGFCFVFSIGGTGLRWFVCGLG